MEHRLSTITKELKKYDRELYCASLPSGKPAVLRRTVRQEIYDLNDTGSDQLVVFKDAPHLVFPLTSDFKITGDVVDWGIEPILARLRAMDLWSNETFVEDLLKSYEKREKDASKDRQNNTESFLYDLRDQFKKDWKDINTASMDKKKDRRYLNDKKLKGDL